MSHPLIRQLDHYVVLEPAASEQRILSAVETCAWLSEHLSQLVDLPADLQMLAGNRERAERLLETSCELELGPGLVIQWFAVRLDPED